MYINLFLSISKLCPRPLTHTYDVHLHVYMYILWELAKENLKIINLYSTLRRPFAYILIHHICNQKKIIVHLFKIKLIKINFIVIHVYVYYDISK